MRDDLRTQIYLNFNQQETGVMLEIWRSQHYRFLKEEPWPSRIQLPLHGRGAAGLFGSSGW